MPVCNWQHLKKFLVTAALTFEHLVVVVFFVVVFFIKEKFNLL